MENLKTGDKVYATGVFLELQADNTWKPVSFDDSTYFEGRDVEEISAVPEENHPFVSDDEFDVLQLDGTYKSYHLETEIVPEQAYANHLEEGGVMTYAEFCADRFIEIE